MIFAAGYGKRLKPLTDSIPKALVRVKNKTLLELTIERLHHFGFNDIIVNIHHFADQITGFVSSNSELNGKISFSDESSEILDTGGGLKKASWFFKDDQPFLVTNVDLITDIDLTAFYRFHLSSDALATIAVQDRAGSRKFLFNESFQLCGWKNEKTGETRMSRESGVCTSLSFNGMHIINPSIFNLIEEKGCFSIIDLYLRLSSLHRIQAYVDKYAWMDVGKPDDLMKASFSNHNHA